MLIQSVSAYSFMYNNQNSSSSATNDSSSNGGTNSSTASGSQPMRSSQSYYDILDISDIDLGDDNTLDAQDIEAALQTPTSKMKRSMRLSMSLASVEKQRFSNIGFDSPFLKKSPNEFITKAAQIFSAYLNPAMSGGDDKVFAYAGDDFETAFNHFVRDQSKQYASGMASFFSENGVATDEQVNKLVGEITQVIKEYGTQLAAGKNITIDDLTSKLHINGMEMSIGDINKMVKTINDINPSKMILDSHADFAVAGLGVAKMKAFTTNTYSEPVAEMIMKTYNQKVTEEINKNDVEILRSKKSSKKNNFIERYLKGNSPELESKKNTNNSVNPYFKLDSQFKGSAKETIFKQFSEINISNIDKSKEDYDKAVIEFEKIMKQWEEKRGYGLSSREVLSNGLKISAAYETLDGYIGLGIDSET